VSTNAPTDTGSLGGGLMAPDKVASIYGLPDAAHPKASAPAKPRRRKAKAAPAPLPALTPSLSPVQEQYRAMKAAHPDYVLLFRMGDFYEAFFDDARTLAKVCGVTLTTRRDEAGDVAMAGVPFHAVEAYLRKLIAAGHKVALAEATGDKGREVVRTVAPEPTAPPAEDPPATPREAEIGSLFDRLKGAESTREKCEVEERISGLLTDEEAGAVDPTPAPETKAERTAEDYRVFLRRKSQLAGGFGFEPIWMPDALFEFQKFAVGWAVRRGRGALFEDCGLGKSGQCLTWAENVVRHANRPVLVLTPLAVGPQMVAEAEKFGMEAERCGDGKPRPGAKIVVANYERLDKFNPDDFAGAVLDEASILKHWSGATQKAVTRFVSQLPYRLICTATPAPNDYIEMGTLSEALGDLTYSDMLATADDIVSSRRLSWRVIQSFGQWAMKAHAFEPFWKWVSSWAIACRKPSDLGPFDDSGFVLPELIRRDHTVVPRTPPEGFLFTVPAFGLNQERQERRRTIDERAELVAKLTAESDSAVVWCHLNPEGDRLEKEIPGAVQVKGTQSMEEKEERILAFLEGEARVLVTKAKIAGLGLNFQHCAHTVNFVDHSWEKFYQCIHRLHRFGQKRPVTLDVIATEGEVNVRRNMDRKGRLADQMFESVIRFMNQAQAAPNESDSLKLEVPSWL